MEPLSKIKRVKTRIYRIEKRLINSYLSITPISKNKKMEYEFFYELVFNLLIFRTIRDRQTDGQNRTRVPFLYKYLT